jgi:hypothetical protein
MKTPERIIKSNKMRDEIIRILEDCPDMSAVYPLLHFMEQECNQVEEFWENAHANTECKLKDEIDKWMKESATFQARKDTLEEWLTEYRDELKKTNVYHKNQGLINEINDLLNWPE